MIHLSSSDPASSDSPIIRCRGLLVTPCCALLQADLENVYGFPPIVRVHIVQLQQEVRIVTDAFITEYYVFKGVIEP